MLNNGAQRETHEGRLKNDDTTLGNIEDFFSVMNKDLFFPGLPKKWLVLAFSKGLLGHRRKTAKGQDLGGGGGGAVF